MGVPGSNDGAMSDMRVVELFERSSYRRVSFVAMELLTLVSNPHRQGRVHPCSNLASPPIDMTKAPHPPQLNRCAIFVSYIYSCYARAHELPDCTESVSTFDMLGRSDIRTNRR
jgi:hypothetical protein